MYKAKNLILSLLLAIAFAVLPVGGAFAATTADVTITATPTYVAITNGTSSWAIGTIAGSTTVYWTADDLVPAEPLVDGDMKSTITNTGSVSVDLTVHSHNFTGGVGWTLATGAGEDTVVLAVGRTGDANVAAMRKLVDTTPQDLYTSGLASSGTLKWCMYLTTGTFTDGTEKTTTVTITATQHT